VTLWALGALLLAAAAVLAIVLGDDPTDTSPSARTASPGTTAAEDSADESDASSAPTLPTLDSSEGAAEELPPGPSPTDADTDPLGVGVPMTPPECDGSWIVILGSATDPATYEPDVSRWLEPDPEAQYVLTEGACTSLRQRSTDGNQIYAVYLGPYPDRESACEVSTEIGGGVYVKRMDDATPPDQTWTC